jgi:hypothetical protein
MANRVLKPSASSTVMTLKNSFILHLASKPLDP